MPIVVNVTPEYLGLSEDELLEQYNNKLRHAVLPVTVFLGLVIILGIVYNLLILYVFIFRYKSCNFRYFVLSLTFIDLISCLTTIPGEIVSQVFWFDYPVPPVCRIKDFFNQFTVCSDAGCLTLIAIDRYRKVCKPFGWQIKRKTAKLACLGIFAVAAVLAIPTQVFWGVRTGTIKYKGQNVTITVCEKAQKYADSQFPFAYAAFNGCLVFISLICMFAMYVMIVRGLIRLRTKKNMNTRFRNAPSESSMESTPSSPPRDVSFEIERANQSTETSSVDDVNVHIHVVDKQTINQVPRPKVSKQDVAISARVRRKTMIMLYLTLIFIVTIIIYYALISTLATGVLAKLTDSGIAAYFFFLRFYFINHAINPILYGLLDPQVRQALRGLKVAALRLCPCKVRNNAV